MSHSDLSNPRLDHILRTLVEHRKLWLLPGIAALLLSSFYVYFIRSDTYTARQTLIVRDDLLGQSLKPGQFESLDLMKSAQETILEISRKPQVIRNALHKIGPPGTSWFGVGSNWPDDETIEDIQGSISLTAPNGAEFGHTETVVLSTKSSSRERAAAFVLALLEEIDIKINEVRDLRLRSMKDELTMIRDSARESLQLSAEQLSAMEREIGADLPTLRALSDPQSGEGTMSQTLLQIRSERRQFENKLHSARNQRETLLAAAHDPNAILATSDELFSFQPALSRLKQELIAAQSSLAASVGRYESAHPQVQKHKEQVRSMHEQIHDELDSAQRGLESQISSLEEKVAKSRSQEAEIDERFNKISSKRVAYLGLDETVKKKSEVFNESQSHLASIQQLDSSTIEVTLLTPVDEPQVSTRADGLGRKTTILACGMAGILAGFGLVLLLVAPPEQDLTPSEAPLLKPQPETKKPSSPSIARPEASPQVAPSPRSVTAVAQEPDAPLALAKAGLEVKPSEPVAASVQSDLKNPLQPVARSKPAVAAPAEPAAETKPAVDEGPNLSAAIDAEFESVAARSAQSNQNPFADQTPVAKLFAKVSQATSPVPTDSPVPEPKVNPKASDNQQTFEEARGQADSTGVPTAASVLAALQNGPAKRNDLASGGNQQQTKSAERSAAAPSVKPIQKASDFQALAKPEISEKPASPKPETIDLTPTSSDPAKQAKKLELHRRASQRPLDLAKQGADKQDDLSTTFVSLETDSPASKPIDVEVQTTPADAQANSSSNPFLNSGQKNGNPSATAHRILAEAEQEAERRGMVAPISPVTQQKHAEETSRMPMATVPIPDQIKQLTDSIASFAKPIDRVSDPGKDADF